MDELPVYILPPKVKAITEGAPKKVTGTYVYLWRDCGTVFYVGLGQLRRAWNSHNKELDGMRRFSSSFTVSIVQDSLSRKDALALKAELQEKYNVK